MADSGRSVVSPGEEYRKREEGREAEAAGFERAHVGFGYLRLLLVVTAMVLGWMSLVRGAVSGWWLLLPALVFCLTALWHARVLRAQVHARRVAEMYRHGLARIEDRWVGLRERGEREEAAGSLYAEDLDLFGRGSLFELLCTARTRVGEETLAGWLLAPAGVSEIRERQAAVAELREKVDFREDMAVVGGLLDRGGRPEAMLRWSEAPDELTVGSVRWAALGLAALAIAAAVWLGYMGFAGPLAGVVLVEAIVHRVLRKRVQAVLGGTDRALEGMRLMASLLARVEGEAFETGRLQGLQGRLRPERGRASEVIGRLATLVQHMDSLKNPIMKLLDVPLMYSVQLAFVVQGWRRLHGREVRGWMEVLGEMEALLSLGTYSYEHPGDPFPEVVEGPPEFSGVQIGHPLIAAAVCVRNDVRLDADEPVIVISGSNMSGKSTLMRAVGMNTVLAMCGAPVRAGRLQMSALRLGASILVNDSLQEGRSRFYAEITRLRAICDLARERPPVLFLLDELLQGTNSRDRLAGAKGIVRALVGSGAIGLLSTHDLAITELGEAEDGRLRNFHFQDRIEDGAMRFDFTLREGVVTKSNGIELMRLVGLDV